MLKFRVWDKQLKVLETPQNIHLTPNGEIYCGNTNVTSKYDLMFSIGINVDKQDVYVNDVLSVHKDNISSTNSFWSSNAGETMKEKNVDEMLVVIEPTDFMSVAYTLYFLRDGKLLTDSEYYEEESGDDDEAYTVSSNEMMFLRYLVQRDVLKSLGTIYKNKYRKLLAN